MYALVEGAVIPSVFRELPRVLQRAEEGRIEDREVILRRPLDRNPRQLPVPSIPAGGLHLLEGPLPTDLAVEVIGSLRVIDE